MSSPQSRWLNRYQKDNRQFLIGSAYVLPVAAPLADAAFAIMMWFHLADLGKAPRELSLILKPSGRFMIFTMNPGAYDIWKLYI